VKGALFASNPALMPMMWEDGRMSALQTMAAHYVVLAHLCGGFLMAIGLVTRIAALAQVPVLFGAVFFVHLEEGLFSRGQNLEFAILVLFLVSLVFVHGPGRWSVDHYLFAKKEPATGGLRASRSGVDL
jgi:uncharacterized membrane protein YphA (DoxX/SURF4 family)